MILAAVIGCGAALDSFARREDYNNGPELTPQFSFSGLEEVQILSTGVSVGSNPLDEILVQCDMNVNEGSKEDWRSWLEHYCEEYDMTDKTEEDCESEEDFPTEDQYLCKICAGESKTKKK